MSKCNYECTSEQVTQCIPAQSDLVLNYGTLPHYHGTPVLRRHCMISFPSVYKMTLSLLKCLMLQVLPLVLLSREHLPRLGLRVSPLLQGLLVSL